MTASKRTLRSIISRMSELKKMYELTLLLDEMNTAQEDDEMMVGLADGEEWMLMEKKDDLLLLFGTKNKLKPSKVNKIYKSAIRYEYIDEAPKPYDTTDDYVFVKPDGQTLIFKRWGVPTGLFRAILAENKHIIGVITLISAIVVTVATVISLVVRYMPNE